MNNERMNTHVAQIWVLSDAWKKAVGLKSFNTFLKNYITLEGAASHYVLHQQQFLIAL